MIEHTIGKLAERREYTEEQQKEDKFIYRRDRRSSIRKKRNIVTNYSGPRKYAD
jgi:hypothetical protein